MGGNQVRHEIKDYYKSAIVVRDADVPQPAIDLFIKNDGRAVTAFVRIDKDKLDDLITVLRFYRTRLEFPEK